MRIGVVIPAYNAGPWIGDAIASVLAQTHSDWTLVVVDDGSTDGTGDLVAAFADPRIRLIRQANAGVSVARNRALNRDVSGRPKAGHDEEADALLFLDADDWLAPDALARLAAALDAAPHAVAASGAYAFVDTGVARRPPDGDLLEHLLVRNLFVNGGHLLIRRQAMQAAGGFRPGIDYGEDWELWIRIALQGPFAAERSQAPVLFVRQHEGSAYQRLASNPASFIPCMTAIFANPSLLARFGSQRLTSIRRHAEAENNWIVGRELIRRGLERQGRARLRQSLLAHPSAKRAALFAASHILPLLPHVWRGPFRPYPLRICALSRACRLTPG